MPTIYKPKPKKKATDAKRKERQNIYQSTRWQRLRALKIADQPLCEMCLKEGRYKAAEDVHHIVSFVGKSRNEQYRLAYDYDNLVTLCKQCHTRIHNS